MSTSRGLVDLILETDHWHMAIDFELVVRIVIQAMTLSNQAFLPSGKLIEVADLSATAFILLCLLRAPEVIWSDQLKDLRY